jgi:hypothetical protein
MDLLTDEQVQDIDQFILQYTKLQDTMGTSLFTSNQNYLYEQNKKYVLFATALRITTRMTMKKMQHN